MALKHAAPYIALMEAGAGRFQENNGASAVAIGNRFREHMRLSGRVPQVAAIMGACFGGPSFTAAQSDFVPITRDRGYMGMSGPAVVRVGVRKTVSPDEIGGWRMSSEAAVDISRLAGLGDAGVICEIMNPDGTMARLPQLIDFAAREGLKVATIAGLIKYRRNRERLVERVCETTVESRHGGRFNAIVFRNLIDNVEHVALVKGDVGDGNPTPVRVHAVNLFDDIVGDRFYSHGSAVYTAMAQIEKAGRGVIVLMRETHRSSSSDVILSRKNRPETTGSVIRDYGTGAQILRELGIREMILLNNSIQPLVALRGYGLKVSEVSPLATDPAR